jgi:G3E family GTPase
LSWTSDRLVSLARLQAAIGKLAPKLARAKGLFEAAEQPGRQFVFQFAGDRATLAPAGTPAPGLPRARIVFVAEVGALSSAEVSRTMDECAHPGPG